MNVDDVLQIDVLEKRARDVLHEIATLRNSLRPVNQLPPEVLASCATFVSDADPRPIVALTHVCRYWRRAISSNPTSWASIATGWKRLVPLCLERAGAVPLVIDITVSDVKSDEDFLTSLLPHASRIGSLRLVGFASTEAVTDDLPGFFSSPMPNLTSLELQQTTEPAELFPSREAPIPPVFQNVARLVSLRLTRTPLYPTLFKISSLRELRLFEYASLFSFGTLVGFLDSNPNLECVALDVRLVADSVKTTPTRKVSLSRLKHLSITCSKAIDSKGLLSCISLPRGANVEVVFTGTGVSAELEPFLPSPPTSIRELLAPITVVRAQQTPREVHLSGNSSAFTFRSPRDPFGARGWLLLFSTTLVRELRVDPHPYRFSDQYLSDMMKDLPALEILVISKATVFPDGFFSALTKEPTLCPALRTIAFFDCDIDPDTMKKLGEALTRRRDSTAARVYRVVIVSNTVTMPDRTLVQQLRKSVPCVDVRMDDKLPDLS